MPKDPSSSMEKPVSDAVVAGKHGAPLISDGKLLDLHGALLGASDASVRFPAIYASLLADLTARDRITAEMPLPLGSFSGAIVMELSASLATGLAIGLAQRKPGSLVVAFTRANRLAPDAFLPTLRAAARHHAPILYVLLPSPAASSTFDWSANAIREEVPCIPADAQDVVALYRVAQETMLRARHGGGPSLIDCKQVQLARGDSNAISRMEAHLRRKGLVPAAGKSASGKAIGSTSRLAGSPA